MAGQAGPAGAGTQAPCGSSPSIGRTLTHASERWSKAIGPLSTCGWRRSAAVGPTQVFQTMLALIDGGERALDDARALLDWAVRAGIDDAIVPRAQVVLLAPVPVPRQMRDFSELRATPAHRPRDAVSQDGGESARSGGGLCGLRPARRRVAARCLVRAADLLQVQPLQRDRHRRRYPLAGLLPTCSITSSSSASFIGKGGVNIRPKRRATTSSGTRSSTTSARATRRRAKWRVSSARPRARISTPATSWARAW